MSFTTRASSPALVLAGLLLAGCAADGSSSFFTTGALGTAANGSRAGAQGRSGVRDAGLAHRGPAQGRRRRQDREGGHQEVQDDQGRPDEGRSADQGQRRIPAALLDDHAVAGCSQLSSPPASSPAAAPAAEAKSGAPKASASGPTPPRRTEQPLTCLQAGCAGTCCGRRECCALASGFAEHFAPSASGIDVVLQLLCSRSLRCCKLVTLACAAVEIIAALCFVRAAARGRERGGIRVPQGVGCIESSGACCRGWRACRLRRAAATMAATPARRRWHRDRAAARSGRSSTARRQRHAGQGRGGKPGQEAAAHGQGRRRPLQLSAQPVPGRALPRLSRARPAVDRRIGRAFAQSQRIGSDGGGSGIVGRGLAAILRLAPRSAPERGRHG